MVPLIDRTWAGKPVLVPSSSKSPLLPFASGRKGLDVEMLESGVGQRLRLVASDAGSDPDRAKRVVPVKVFDKTADLRPSLWIADFIKAVE